MKKIFSIEWDDVSGPDWMSIGNLKECLFTKNHVGRTSSIAVEDITEKASQAIDGFKKTAIGSIRNVEEATVKDSGQFYKEVGMTRAFLVEWVDGVPLNVNVALIRACLFQAETFMDRREVKIRPIAYPDEVKSVVGPTEFNKMASTNYIHKDDVVEILKEFAEEVSPVSNRGRVVAIANNFLKSKGINQRFDVVWRIVVVQGPEGSTIAKEKGND